MHTVYVSMRMHEAAAVAAAAGVALGDAVVGERDLELSFLVSRQSSWHLDQSGCATEVLENIGGARFSLSADAELMFWGRNDFLESLGGEES